MPKKNQEVKWRDSEAKKFLQQDLISGDIPLDSSTLAPQEVYLQRTAFADFGEYDKFPARLRGLRSQITDKNNRGASDSIALAHDRRIFPKPTHNGRGEPRWEGSDAERLLKLDIDEGKHKTMQPKELHQSRGEFQNYKLKLFREHIYQEEKRCKFLASFKKA